MLNDKRYTLPVLRAGFARSCGHYLTIFLLLGLFLSCEVPTEAYDNPLDEEVAAEKGIDMPALVFFPDKFDDITAGSSISVKLYALEVVGVAGAHIQISFYQFCKCW